MFVVGHCLLCFKAALFTTLRQFLCVSRHKKRVYISARSIDAMLQVCVSEYNNPAIELAIHAGPLQCKLMHMRSQLRSEQNQDSIGSLADQTLRLDYIPKLQNGSKCSM